jgi:transposase
MNYSGIDLHKDNSFITTINDIGQLIKQCRVRNNEAEILQYFQNIGGPHRAVVEATSGWYWLNDLLEANGIEMVLAHAKYIKAIAYAKVKTDKVDSQTLATLLRMNLVTPAHKISQELRGMRDMMRTRLRFVQKRTACYNSVHRIAEKFNCDMEITVSERTIPNQLPEYYHLQLRLLYQQIDLIDQQITEIEKSLRNQLIPNEDIQRLLWVPAFGLITAYTVYLEIDGIERFPGERQLFSYCRVVPGANNSNRSLRHKSGNKDGNKYLKIAFTDAAVHATRYYPEIRAYYQKILRRSNQAIARTVIAKELCRIVFHILTEKTEYKGFKGKPISRQKALNWPRLASPVFTLAQKSKPSD